LRDVLQQGVALLRELFAVRVVLQLPLGVESLAPATICSI